MKSVSKDAEQREKDRKIRKEKSETFRTQATKAFRRREFERALTLYDKVSGLFFSIVKVSTFLFSHIFATS